MAASKPPKNRLKPVNSAQIDSKLREINQIGDLIPDDRNANRGNERGKGLLSNSLRNYGAGRSVLLDRNGKIIAGNKTVESALSLGLTEVIVVPTDGRSLVAVQRTDLDMDRDPRARELAIADNRVAELDLEWDPEVLAELGKDINLGQFWNDDELEGLLGDLAGEEQESGTDAQVDPTEALEAKWRPTRGDVWEIQSATSGLVHRLMCGDAREDVVALFQSVTPDLLLTDPPYGISIVKSGTIGGAKVTGFNKGWVAPPGGPRSLGFSKTNGQKGTVGGANKVASRMYSPVVGDDEPFDPNHLIGLCKFHIIFGANHFASRLPDSGAWLVWDKGVAADCTFSGAELAWSDIGQRLRLYRHTWSGMTREGERKIEMVERVHPTQKPVGLFRQILEDFSSAASVADLYAGSGSIAVACELTGRSCYAMEIEPKYVAVILERMSAMGLEPRKAESPC